MIFASSVVKSDYTITNSGLIAGGQNSSRERQTVICTAVNPMNKNHKDPQELDLSKPSLEMCKRKWRSAPGYDVLGRFTVCSTQRIEVPSNKIERNHPLRYTPSLLYLENCCDGIWRNYMRENIFVTSASFKDFLQK